MGEVIFDETDKPVMRMTYDGLCDEDEWARHIEQMSDWAHRGVSYAVVVDARKVGKVPAAQRKGIIDWIDRDRLHLKANCAAGALIFSNAVQRGLWTAISWVAPSPIPVKIFGDLAPAEAWLRHQLQTKMAS